MELCIALEFIISSVLLRYIYKSDWIRVIVAIFSCIIMNIFFQICFTFISVEEIYVLEFVLSKILIGIIYTAHVNQFEWKKCFIITGACVLMDLIFYNLLLVFFHYISLNVKNMIAMDCLELLGYILIILIFYNKDIDVCKSIEIMTLKEGIFCTIIITFLCCILWFLSRSLTLQFEQQTSVVFAIILLLIVIFSLFCMEYYLYEKQKKRELVLQMKWNYEFQEQQKKYYQLKEEKNRELYALNHDFVKHLRIVERLIDLEEIQECKEYIRPLVKQVKSKEIFKSGNWVFDCFFCDMILESELNREQWSLVGLFPNLDYVSTNDLCVLFGNIFDNISEAMKEIEPKNRECKIKISSVKNMIFIDIWNKQNNNGKGACDVESKLHGFGLDNVNRVVKKYDGIMETREEEDIFYMRIGLKNIRSEQ